jgi:hypothetical protein
MVRTINKRDTEGSVPEHNQVHIWQTVNVILNGQKLKAFPLRSEASQRCTLPPVLFNMIFEILSRAKMDGWIDKWMDRKKNRWKENVFP